MASSFWSQTIDIIMAVLMRLMNQHWQLQLLWRRWSDGQLPGIHICQEAISGPFQQLWCFCRPTDQSVSNEPDCNRLAISHSGQHDVYGSVPGLEQS